ncbi:MAG: hypothetical protein ACLFVJ_17110 [Persicimonas sp.]
MYRPRARSLTALLIGATLMLSGCATDDPVDESTRDSGGSDADTTTTDAVTTDATDTADAADDASPDTAGDVGPDVEEDVGEDATDDVEEDVGEDATDDAATDTGADTGADGSREVPGDTCETAIDVTSGGSFDTETTTDATDDYSASASDENCPSGQFSGKDKVYAVSPTTTTTYEVSVVPVDDFDPFIYTRDDCSQPACIDGTVLNGPGDPESLTFDVQGGETVFVIVDGELGSEGDYSLSVQLP